MPVTKLLHSNIPVTLQTPKHASHGYKSDRSEFESDKFDISSANSDGLSCLASNSFIRRIFPEDLRSVTAREILKTSSPVPSSSIDLTRELVKTIAQLMVEEKLIEVSKRTISKLFERGLATVASSTKSPIVDNFRVPKIDLSLSLE